MTVVSPFQEFKVVKSYVDNGVLYREGWISTNDLDRQRDITEPEAFAPVLKSYFERSAPVTNTHDIQSYPIGHLQRGALVRDGKIFLEAVHPTDPAEFTSTITQGSGFFGRLAVNDPIAAHQVSKGNMGGCSFIAYESKSEKLPGGGKRYLEFSDLMETTIAAFPINPYAVLRVAKAYGYPQQDEEEMTQEEIQQMIANAIAASQAPVQKAEVPAVLTIQDVTGVITTALTAHSASIDAKLEEVKKATIDFSRQGVGRAGATGPMTPEQEREADPAAYIVKKANSGEELSLEDKDLIHQLTYEALTSGMSLS